MNFRDRFSLAEQDIIDYLLGLYEPKPKGPPKVIPKEELRVACSPGEITRGTGFHKHRCRDCGYTWKHSDEFAGPGISDSDFNESHTCAQCGREETWKHYAAGEELWS